MNNYNIGTDLFTNPSLYPMYNTNQQQYLDTYKGFLRGNLFDKLYVPYKNYTPNKLVARDEREDILMQIQEYTFALIDLGLYLDVNPNDSNLVNLYNNYLITKKQLVDLYNSKYSPLTLDAEMKGNTWNWDSKFPWEVGK